MTAPLACRSCGSTALQPVIDLGMQPLANNLLRTEDLGKTEPRFPLEVRVCQQCWLMQLTQTVPPVDLFSDYLYFSSFSDEMLHHATTAASRYLEEKPLDASSFVVEVASNDGYLLKNFTSAGVPNLGIEPAVNVAEVARAAGVDTLVAFFGEQTAADLCDQRGHADLILANNVFAHAPDTNDFVAGISTLLASDGWAVLEFPYGADMIANAEFDTIYHEHVFCFTLTPLVPLFARHGLTIFHVERLRIHGGSLRLFVCHNGTLPVGQSVIELRSEEDALGVSSSRYYERFGEVAEAVRSDLTQFLETQQTAQKRVAAYGASAKGSTLLNFVGAPAGTLEFIADRSPHKQGRRSPGLHIPIVPAEALAQRAPDYALLLTWNFADEIMSQQRDFVNGGGRFVLPLPEVTVVDA